MDPNSLKPLLEQLDAGVCLLDKTGGVIYANSFAVSLLGYGSSDHLFGQHAAAFGGEELGNALTDLDKPFSHDLARTGLFRRYDDQEFPVTFRLAALEGDHSRYSLWFRANDGSPSCAVIQAETQIELDVVLNTIAEAVIVVDTRGSIQLVNAAAERLFGYSGDEILGKNVNVLMPSPDHEAHDGYIRHYLETGEKRIIGIGREVVAKRKSGELVPVYLSIGDAKLGSERLFVGVLHDLTSKKRNEAQVTMLSSAIEQSPIAIAIVNTDGEIEYVNSGFSALTGHRDDAALGKPLSLVMGDPVYSDELRDLLKSSTAAGSKHSEVQGRRRDGSTYWALQSISPLREKDGQSTRFLVAQIDITGQKRDKQALQESEARFQQVAEMTGEWLWEQDPSGCYIYCSNAVFGILGYQPDEILGKSYLDLMTQDDRLLWQGQTAEMAEQKSFHKLTNRYRHREGHEVFTESSGAPIFDAEGKVIKWRGVDSDITARKRYEDALRLRDRAIEAAIVGIDITDARLADNPNIYVNHALSQITGYPKEELMGRSMAILQGPDTDPEAVKKISDALREGNSCEVILKNYRKDGTPFWNDLLISPVHDEFGVLTHFIGVQSDVTELRRAAEERHELEIAKQIQLSLLPKAPVKTPEFQVAGICLPATHVGGDYYDYFFLGDSLDVVIADVSGHSVGAALIMAEARSALQAETRLANSGRMEHGIAGILQTLNEVLYEDLNGADLFISMFYLRYDPFERRLFYSNAGHNCPLLLSGDAQQCRQLDAEGLLLGVQRKVEFAEESELLHPGDRILLYTDGITEAQNHLGEFFGVARLCSLLCETRHESPERTIELIVQRLRDFCQMATFTDDVSLVVLDIDTGDSLQSNFQAVRSN